MSILSPKKLALGSGATAALLGAFLLGGVALNQANAAPPATPGTPAVTTTEQNEPPIDPSKVKLTADQAKQAALAKYPNATVQQPQLEDENGTLVWGMELTDSSGKAYDVKVDGNSGQVLKADAGGPDGVEAPETGN